MNLPASGWAHSDLADAEKIWWLKWNWSPVVLINLSLLALLYRYGWRKRYARNPGHFRVKKQSAISFTAGLVSVFIALISPLDPLSDVLASAHMIQHTILMMIAAPLVVLGWPGQVFFLAIPQALRKKMARVRRRVLLPIFRLFAPPLLIWALYALTLWLWHLPRLYQTAMLHPFVHDLQHLSFFATAYFFWKAVFKPPFGRRGLHPALGIIYLFVASLQTMVLGVLMALSPFVWYPLYQTGTERMGLSALEDQQIAGYIMWMPAGITYVLAALFLLLRLLQTSSPKVRSGEKASLR